LQWFRRPENAEHLHPTGLLNMRDDPNADTLISLAEKMRGQEVEFRKTAAKIDTSMVKAVLLEYSSLAANAKAELTHEASRLGVRVREQESLKDMAAELVETVRSSIRTPDELSLVSEARASADDAAEGFREALETDLELEAKETLRKLLIQIEHSREQLKAVEQTLL
jgi:vacuolar-type H+-ATPase subunit D/Vma8